MRDNGGFAFCLNCDVPHTGYNNADRRFSREWFMRNTETFDSTVNLMASQILEKTDWNSI